MIRRWWHRRRWADCEVCGVAFRKGRGGGVSRSVMCSNACYAQAWADFMKGGKRR